MLALPGLFPIGHPSNGGKSESEIRVDWLAIAQTNGTVIINVMVVSKRFLHLCAAICAYALFILIFVLLALVMFVLLTVSPFLFLVAIGKRGWKDACRIRLTSRNLEYYEEVALRHYMPNSRCRHDYTEVAYDGEVKATMHALLATQNEGEQARPALVFVHGTGGSALSFAESLEHLAHTHDVFAVHLPGFSGRSPCSKSFAPKLRNPSKALDFYCECLKTFLQKHQLCEVGAVGAQGPIRARNRPSLAFPFHCYACVLAGHHGSSFIWWILGNSLFRSAP